MKRGRPREIDNPVRVNLSVPADQYDQLYRIARQHDETIQAVIRRGVIYVLTNRAQAATAAQ